jgi:hypothetical protein
MNRSPLRFPGLTLLVAATASSLTLAGAPNALAVPCALPDLPSCTCYDGVAAWPFSGVPGDLIRTAKLTVDTYVTCIPHGGQPYWQIQQQVPDPLLAEWIANIYPSCQVDLPPEEWCTETVAFWGVRSRLPYDQGFQALSHHPSAQVTGSNEMRTWFATEEGSGGRGRWIDGSELDYDNFIPGVNGPCPGAYQQIYHWDWADTNGNGQLWDGIWGHSQVVDSMVVYRLGNVTGPVQRIDLHMIEGNSLHKVRNDRWYRDIYDFTTLGPDTVFLDVLERKIRGWGVILDRHGDPVFDPDRIHTSVTMFPKATRPPFPDHSDDVLIASMIAFAQATGGSLGTVTNSKLVQVEGWPTDLQPWRIPQGPHPVDPVAIGIDLLAEHPVPLRGITLRFKEAVPARFLLRWADAQGNWAQRWIYRAQDPPPVAPGTVLPLSVDFAPGQAFPVRYIILQLENAVLTRDFEVQGFSYRLDGRGVDNGNDTAPGGDASVVGVGESPAPSDFWVHPTSPGVARIDARLEFNLPAGGATRLIAHDAQGRITRILLDEELPAGRHVVSWDGRDGSGREIAGGIYFIRLEWEGRASTTRVVWLR